MTSKRHAGRWLLVSSALLVHLPGAARAQSAGDESALGVANEKALQTFKEGISAFDRRDFEAARVAFLQTFALKPSAPVVRRNLGLAEIYSGYYLEGARRLARVIHTTDEGTSLDRARMLESLRKAEAHLERVTLEVNVEGAEIMVDGVDLGVSPLPFAWYLAPGSYDVSVTKPGFVAFAETRLARAGAAQHLRISLKPVPPPEPLAPLATSAVLSEPELDSGANPWVLALGGALTAGGVAAGVTFSLFAADNSDKVERIGDSLGGIRCRSPNRVAACDTLSSAAAEYDRQVRWATVTFALGAAAGVSTLVYALLARPHRAQDHGSAYYGVPEQPPLLVLVGAGGARVLLDTTF